MRVQDKLGECVYLSFVCVELLTCTVSTITFKITQNRSTAFTQRAFQSFCIFYKILNEFYSDCRLPKVLM